MMKNIVKLLLTLVIVGVFSCQQKENKDEIVVKQSVEQEDDFKFSAVSLNNGQLWQANTETTQGIKNMQQLMTDFSIENGDSETLISALKDEFAQIFKKCTMTGEAHEQLHNYLFPLKTRINRLTEEVNEQNTADLQKYLEDYFTYFQ